LGGGARIPTLDEVLDWSKRRGALLNVELKRDVSDRERLVANVAQTLTFSRVEPSRVLLSSFDPAIVKHLSRVLPTFPTGYLLDSSWPRWPLARAFRRLGAAAVHPHESLITRRFLKPLVRRGALVNVYGVNDEGRARELHELGVDAIISDVPGRIRVALARAGDD
jgi:glycerophosphoryl diester phosphodiesterase